MAIKTRNARKRRQKYVRLKVSGTTERPRLNVFRSLHHIYAQVIDDSTGHTLASASTVDKEVAAMTAGKNKKDQAAIVGKIVAERAKSAGFSRVVFDRGGYLYHGRVKALADGAREGGLEF
jgi:large subunit ribosomal protein L18